MNVRMKPEVARPRVQDHRHAQSCAEARLAELEQRLTRRTEEGVEDFAGANTGERA